MPLTTEQIAVLKTDILNSSDPDVIAARDSRNDTEMARLYNLTTSTICWRTLVTQDEIMLNGFDWARVDNLSVGKARIWEWLFDNNSKSINPSKTNVRAGIDATWVGTAADLAVRAAVYVHCKRAARRIEKLFSTGTGTNASPGTFVYEGTVSVDDIGKVYQE